MSTIYNSELFISYEYTIQQQLMFSVNPLATKNNDLLYPTKEKIKKIKNSRFEKWGVKILKRQLLQNLSI